ncbi:MAG: hypothetical protein PHH13_04260 [Candidatus Peribacteraceae bacterium]|nr:hypothetical protein [Candidatus Peribacteraceae bacterium]
MQTHSLVPLMTNGRMRRFLARFGASAVLWMGITTSVCAQAFDGAGISQGVNQAASNLGVTGGSGDIRSTIESIVTTVLSYMALAAVVVIVIAGIRLIISSGDDSAVEKAKKTILYAIIGLIIILLANAIVSLVITAGGGSTT